jgi:hypothetical protein
MRNSDVKTATSEVITIEMRHELLVHIKRTDRGTVLIKKGTFKTGNSSQIITSRTDHKGLSVSKTRPLSSVEGLDTFSHTYHERILHERVRVCTVIGPRNVHLCAR